MARRPSSLSSGFESTREEHVQMPATRQSFPSPTHELRLVDTGEEPSTVQPSWRSLFTFTTRKHFPAIVAALSITFVSSLIRPTSTIFFGKIFSVLTQFGAGSLGAHDTLEQISRWCTVLAGLGGLSWLIEGTFVLTWMVFGELQAKWVRGQMLSGMLDKEMEWYDMQKDGIGSLLIRIQTQIRELQLALSQPMGFLLYEVFSSFASLGVALYYSWKLTLVIISSFPIAATGLYFVSRRLGPAIEAQKRELTQASKYANTAMSSIITVKAYNGQDHEIWQYYETIKKVAACYLIQAAANAMQYGITKFVMVSIFVQGFWFGLYLVDKGMDPGHVLTTFYACLNAMQAMETVLPEWMVLAKGISAGQTLQSIRVQMQNGRKVTKMVGSLRPRVCFGDIELNQVTFAYPTNLQQPALNDVTFFFPAGETTFVVGTSGSGKSTLGNLLMKYYDPSRGEVLIDGHSIQTLDPNWLRQNVALVQQQNVLFNETVFQNIAFGRQSDVTEQDVLNASKTADLGHTIRGLPEGLATMVGSNGKSLSGGQQQRIAIARARLRDSPIVILDEATSALDQASRQTVMKAIREWRKEKSTIIISHDVSQIRDEEYVYVMEHGRVVQEGWRKELAEKGHGTFASFVANSEPTDQSVATIEQRRESGPLTPISAASEYSEEKIPPHWNYHDYVSSFFGMQETPSDSLARSLSVRGNKRMTLGLGGAHANELRAKDLWSNNPALAAGDQSETSNPAHFRQPLIPFVSPQLDPKFPSQPWSPAPPSRVYFSASQALSHHRSSLNEVARPKSRPPAINTSLDALRAAIQLSPRPRQPNSGHTIPKTTKKTKPDTLADIFRTIWPILAWRDRTWLMLGFLSAFVVAISTPAFAFIFSKLLTVYTLDSNRTAAALKWALALLAVASVDGIANYWTHYALECSGQAWVNALRVSALKRILAQPKHWFEKKTNSPDRLNECLDRNAEEMRNLVGRFAGPIFTTVCMMTLSIVWSFIISWKLTLVAIGCGSIAYLATWSFDLISSKWEGKCDRAAQHTSSIFTETFSNIRVVRALTLENHFIRKHSDAVSETFKIGLSRAAYSGLMYGLSDTMSYFITATIFYYGTVIITEGELKVSSVLEVVNLLLFGIANCMVMVAMVPQINSSRITATQMLHLVSLPLPTSHETLGTKRLATPFPIMFNNLSFTYPSRINTKTLSNITLTINARTCTAIVGGSGCGKSTIAAMLVGFYSPDPVPRYDAPSLTFGGTSIQDCKISSLRNLIALVPQTPQLFPSSILANITYGLPESSPFATLNSAMMATQDAGIHDFIMSLPLGYQTVIGDGGLGLSGGQAQRIAIARALVRRPKVLILDEATSALDAVSAEAVRETVRKLMARGREGMEGDIAVVIISHSVEMMRVADRIVVIEGGRVVEEGRYGFDELRRRDGPFAGLVGRQDVHSEVETIKERAMTPVKGRNRQSWARRTSTSS